MRLQQGDPVRYGDSEHRVVQVLEGSRLIVERPAPTARKS
ncbi:Mycobacterium rhizamassiliense ORFan [Mycobacterium rhizamassiliense]|jgi:hypothetical protein|uniref:Mycobacterium numidiamassiliense ORFan n=2 Tax=Mycobacterium TaxID=1763 RepID=A0A2U3PAC8_9MYCO|nr:Mycobacterium rhizamassiliense ORFan [Mycobacterium rhizamassiliense]SPM40686.1 Mycobacterium numidiamassiliense ORFan [Mycobacterium numidiamassiliense]